MTTSCHVADTCQEGGVSHSSMWQHICCVFSSTNPVMALTLAFGFDFEDNGVSSIDRITNDKYFP
jgi:hypothetical protein